MAYPFRRTASSPEDGYYSSDSSPPRGRSPMWRSSSKRKIPDSRRIVKYVVYFTAVIALCYVVSTLGFGRAGRGVEKFTADGLTNKNHFIDFEGALDCRLSSTELYVPPLHNTPQAKREYPYCKSRGAMMQAISHGGRHGFDMPFFPKGCHFKWYNTLEICMILDRFDGVVFVGDEIVERIYAAFNVLLRQDLVIGAMQQWRMSQRDREACRCGRQFTNPECFQYFVTQAEDVAQHDSESLQSRAPYLCNRVPHFFLRVAGSPAQIQHTQRFSDLLDLDPHSWKPVAVVHGLGVSTRFEWDPPIDSMDEWLTIADNSGRNTPFLWVGPNAAGHLKPPGKILQEGNNALWYYTHEMTEQAEGRAVDAMNMYNMTLQANSYDGSNYGERVTLVQAMMIVNWLARLETT